MNTSSQEGTSISRLLLKQREFFRSGRTKDVAFRIEQLKRLKQAVLKNETALLEACKADMRKPAMEAFTSERGMVLNEIDHAMRNLRAWARPQKAPTPLLHTRFFGLAQHFPASSRVYAEPYGVVLIIGPWNYPFQLTLVPLVGAIAAGNCAVLKPSEAAPASSRMLARMIGGCFDPAYVAVVEGDAETAGALLSERFDFIFFTGGTRIGKLVMEAAARQLTPVVLELGGKNPCIVDRNIPVKQAARRIAWGKFFNAGQTCMTTDYLLVDRAVKQELLAHLAAAIREFFGKDPSKSPDYGRIINDRHFQRIVALMKEGDIITGGETDPADRYIAPTVVDNVLPEHAIMQEEIFGPLLPVIGYETLDDAIAFVNDRPKPLALFFFSRDRDKQDRVLRETSSGGGCINETFVHGVSFCLPFGGVGASGIGKYHGKFSFEVFSNRKGIIKKSFFPDLKMRYPPYKDKFERFKRFL